MMGSDVVHTSVSVSVLSCEMLKGSCCIYVHVELCYFTQNLCLIGCLSVCLLAIHRDLNQDLRTDAGKDAGKKATSVFRLLWLEGTSSQVQKHGSLCCGMVHSSSP